MKPTTPNAPSAQNTPPASASGLPRGQSRRNKLSTPPASANGLPRGQSRRNKLGTSVVEMAIVLPLLLTLMFAIGEFGIMFTQYQTLINAAREGARTGVLFRGTNCAAATVKAQIATTVNDYMVGTGIQTGTLTTTSSGECSGSGTQLVVRSAVPYSFAALPGLAGLQSSITLSARSTMRNE